MRAAILGAGSIALRTARLLLGQGHEVIIVDPDKERIDALAEQIDCGLIHGDGSKPLVLRDLDPARTDVLFCLSNNDQTNILASLVGRSLGFARVVTRIEDPEFEKSISAWNSDWRKPSSRRARSAVYCSTWPKGAMSWK